ncbi:MAG TPA: peptidoglycan-binding domain-containing protein [Candidatus Paceibacterota bacterium]
MKKFLLAGLVGAGLLPGLALAAAYNDVSIPGSTNFSVNGVSMAVTAGGIVNTVVDTSSFTITVAPGSSAKVVANSGNQMALSGSTGFVTDTHCNSNNSDFTLAAASNSATTTITVTPSTSTLCGQSSGGSGSGAVIAGASGGGGGGGGGGSIVPASTPAATTPASAGTVTVASLQAQLNALLAQIKALGGKASPSASALANANANASFKRNLSLGATGADVKALQVYLNTHGFIVTSNGAGSPGKETSKFGGLTKKALAKWQASVGISPAAGNFGPLTRAYIASHP